MIPVLRDHEGSESLLHDPTRSEAGGAEQALTRFFEYTVFFSDDRAAVIHASSRDAALEEARGFYPAAPPERIFDGWRTHGAITGAVLGQVSPGFRNSWADVRAESVG